VGGPQIRSAARSHFNPCVADTEFRSGHFVFSTSRAECEGELLWNQDTMPCLCLGDGDHAIP